MFESLFTVFTMAFSVEETQWELLSKHLFNVEAFYVLELHQMKGSNCKISFQHTTVPFGWGFDVHPGFSFPGCRINLGV